MPDFLHALHILDSLDLQADVESFVDAQSRRSAELRALRDTERLLDPLYAGPVGYGFKGEGLIGGDRDPNRIANPRQSTLNDLHASHDEAARRGIPIYGTVAREFPETPKFDQDVDVRTGGTTAALFDESNTNRHLHKRPRWGGAQGYRRPKFDPTN